MENFDPKRLVAQVVEAAEFNLKMLKKIQDQASNVDDPNDPEALKCVAFALYYARNDRAAAHYLNILATLAPTGDVFATLAQAQFRSGDWERAEAAARQSLEFEPSSTAFQILAASSILRGDYSDAVSAAREAAAHDPSDPRNQELESIASSLGDGKAVSSVQWKAMFGANTGRDLSDKAMELGIVLGHDPAA